jgi:hypothetical protein
MPDEMKVRREGSNNYAFDFGGGAVETIVVDGSDQPGTDGTTLSVKPDAPDTWTVRRKKAGRLLLTATWKLSPDGARLTDHFSELESDRATFSVDYVYQRIGGGSGFAADWQSIKETVTSLFLLEVKPFQGDGLSFVDPVARRTKNLKFDGADLRPNAAAKGGAIVSSSVRRVNDRVLVITNSYEGKVTSTEEFSLSTDLRLLTMTVHIVGRDRPYVLMFERK